MATTVTIIAYPGLKNKKVDTFILPSFEMKTWNFSPVEPLRLFCFEVSRELRAGNPGVARCADQRLGFPLPTL